MKVPEILNFYFVLLLTISCKNAVQKKKEQQINARISEMKTEMDSINKEATKVLEIPTAEIVKKQTKQENKADKIIGIWEVKNKVHLILKFGNDKKSKELTI